MVCVKIKGRDLKPCARLLEALTSTGCLGNGVTWTDHADCIVLHFHYGDQAEIMRVFNSKAFDTYVVEE